MAAFIFWFVCLAVTISTIAFMITAIFEYFSNNITVRVGANSLKWFLFKADIVFAIIMIAFWFV